MITFIALRVADSPACSLFITVVPFILFIATNVTEHMQFVMDVHGVNVETLLYRIENKNVF